MTSMKLWATFMVVLNAVLGAYINADAAVVEYEWNVRPTLSLTPDCHKNREMIVVNGMFPGPELRANVGDTVRITIVNHDPVHAISIHYHGLHMMGQPYADGGAFVSQCPLGPLQSQLSEFVAYDPGTHYWHAHSSLLRTDGLQGVIVITDRDNEHEQALAARYDGERVLMLQDWFHATGDRRRTGLDSSPFRWIGNPQTLLLNGKGMYGGCPLNGSATCTRCGANRLARILVEPGKTYRLRLVNGGSLMALNFAVAGHKLTVVEADGTLVDPFEVDHLDIAVGQRYSVLLTTDQTPSHYAIRTATRFRRGTPQGKAFLSYSNYGGQLSVDRNDVERKDPTQPQWDDLSALVLQDLTLRTASHNNELYSLPDAEPDRKILLVRTQNRNENNQLRWAINNITQIEPNIPVIAMAKEAADRAGSWPVEIPGTIDVPESPSTVWDYTTDVYESVGEGLEHTGVPVIRLNKGDVVEVVLQNARALNYAGEAHYYHLHGQPFWIVGQGIGTYDEERHRPGFNLHNPVRRDTLSLWPLGWTAVRFKADNVGVWSFHCAIASHFVMGQGLLFVVQPDELPPLPPSVTSCYDTSQQSPLSVTHHPTVSQSSTPSLARSSSPSSARSLSPSSARSLSPSTASSSAPSKKKYPYVLIIPNALISPSSAAFSKDGIVGLFATLVSLCVLLVGGVV